MGEPAAPTRLLPLHPVQTFYQQNFPTNSNTRRQRRFAGMILVMLTIPRSQVKQVPSVQHANESPPSHKDAKSTLLCLRYKS